MQIPHVLVCGFYRILAAKLMLRWSPKNINRSSDTSSKPQRANSRVCAPPQQVLQEVQHHVLWDMKISSHLACRFAARRRQSWRRWLLHGCWANHRRWMEAIQAQRSPKCTSVTVETHNLSLAQALGASWGCLHFACVVAVLWFKVGAKNIVVQARAWRIYVLLA